MIQKLRSKNRLLASGFTLIELLVVIAIIGILTAIILPNFNTAKAKSRDGKRVSDIKQIQLALELYSENCGGVYPQSLTSTASCSGTTVSVATYLAGSILPKDPSTNLSYAYVPLTLNNAPSGTCNGYHLGAATEEGGSSLTGDTDVATQEAACVGGTATYGTGSGGTNNSTTITSGNASTADFYGTSAQCTTTGLTSSQTGYNYCYDVTN